MGKARDRSGSQSQFVQPQGKASQYVLQPTIVKLSCGIILEMEGLDLQVSDIDEGTDVVCLGEADALVGIANV